jgi:hypothetical protein
VRSKQICNAISDRWGISQPQIDLIVPDPNVLSEGTHTRDRWLGPAQFPVGHLVQRDPRGRGRIARYPRVTPGPSIGRPLPFTQTGATTMTEHELATLRESLQDVSSALTGLLMMLTRGEPLQEPR